MQNEVILIGSDTLGAPDEQLGALLMGNFLRLLAERDELPRYVVLWNAGVKLAASGAAAAEHLSRLQERGVEIISCRTCVEYFGLENEMAAGKIDGMVRIQDVLTSHCVLTV